MTKAIGAWSRALGIPIVAACSTAVVWAALGLPNWLGVSLVVASLVAGTVYGFWSANRYEGHLLSLKAATLNVSRAIGFFAAIAAVDWVFERVVPEGLKDVLNGVALGVVAVWVLFVARNEWRRRHQRNGC
jgi:hypothetical protein